jgi:hypothetical protein
VTPPTKSEARTRSSRPRDPAIRITDFKETCARLLGPKHPVNLMLARTPDVLKASELDARLDDWLAVLEA